jgi:hypothetical protein
VEGPAFHGILQEGWTPSVEAETGGDDFSSEILSSQLVGSLEFQRYDAKVLVSISIIGSFGILS